VRGRLEIDKEEPPMTDAEVLARWDVEEPIAYPISTLARAEGTLRGIAAVTDDHWITSELNKVALQLRVLRLELYRRGL
jgi:hypothetical protein